MEKDTIRGTITIGLTSELRRKLDKIRSDAEKRAGYPIRMAEIVRDLLKKALDA